MSLDASAKTETIEIAIVNVVKTIIENIFCIKLILLLHISEI